ncbi:ARM repeat-containing protein [Xylariomycetidae sp. FL2044]|nr:ARM repeat-containing protein [Xylariomycetidae sp. FL2044]
MDEYHFRAQQSPRNEAPMNSLVSPPRNGRPMPQPVSQDPRATLPRRFTTDSGRVPTLSNFANLSSPQRLPEPQEYPTANEYKVQLLEKKKIEYEKLREQRRRFEVEMHKLDQQQIRDEFDIAQMQEDLGRGNGMNVTGHQSEPTTPPEYRESSSGFPTMFSRPNRYSASSLVSPPGFFTRSARSGSQLASPQSGVPQSRFFDDQFTWRSVPASRRNSDEDEKEEALRQDPTSHRSTNALNRYSMPVTRRGNLYDNIDQTNTAGFLFRDDESTMETNTYAAIDSGEDSFPQLYSQKGNPNVLSASSVAVDLAAPLTSTEAATTNGGWASLSRHRQQQSLSTLGASQMSTTEAMTTTQAATSLEASAMGGRPHRSSLDSNQYKEMPNQFKELPNENTNAANMTANMASQSQILSTPPKLQTSFSSSDIPTMKNAPSGGMTPSSNANAHAQQHFHNHNASIGRIPPGAMKRHSRELSSDLHIAVSQSGAFPTIQSQLQGNAPAFGPIASSQAALQSPVSAGSVGSPSQGSFQGGYYGGYTQPGPGNPYNVGALSMTMQNMSINGNTVHNTYPPQNYTGYGQIYQNTVQQQQPRDSQSRIMQNRRMQDNEAMSQYVNLPLEAVVGNIYNTCKDQHGCRYLQKQLEGRNPDHIHLIFLETREHVVELMIDPFGNYLCQKLIEYCSDAERTELIRNASGAMVTIATNQHGTRALQKMIEFVGISSSPELNIEQVHIVIGALQKSVVHLIQDLNGNHVIQKCLNKLSSNDSKFIFTAVGNNCVAVGTHRHGCCVLQRCIDHAVGEQKRWLIQRITENVSRLVSDPFGNYVVQYIIDLNDPTFTGPVVDQLIGNLGNLSRHKFSSNVVEKCLRCASDQSKKAMVEELMASGEMDRLLRDSYGNYVVQTALEHAPYAQKQQLIETIRPIIPAIRSTPYGRRLATKISSYENQSGSNSGHNSGQSTPADPTQGQIAQRPAHNRPISNQSIHPSAVYTNGVRGQVAYPTPNNLTVGNPPPQPPRMNQFSAYSGAGVSPGSGEGSFF